MAMAKPTVVLLPVWASGHFIAALEAGKRLVAALGTADFSLTVLVMRPPTPESASQVAAHVARGAAAAEPIGCEVSFHHLPAVDPPTGCTSVEYFTSQYIHLHAPYVRAAVAALPVPAAALVFEFTSTTMFDVARELGVPAYVYFASSAAMLALMLQLPAIHDVMMPEEFGEMEGQHVHVQGLPPVPASCMPASVMSRKSPSYADTVYHGTRLAEADGIIVNTAAELEPAVLAAINDGRCTGGRPAPPVYPIGPVIPLSDATSSDHECLRWLDGQPRASVVFLCFGSLGFLNAEQVGEAAAGLERSGQRFLWVLRSSPPAAATASAHPLAEHLPPGFLDRTKDQGLVWTSWAPQREVLAHHAVAGFVTHCGWNSVLEALWSGVPMAPWPLYAEQHLNAFELVASMGVAVRMDVDRKRSNFVEAGEVARAVRCLVSGGDEEGEGRRARERALAMRDACRRAVAQGGSSFASLHGAAAAVRHRLEAGVDAQLTGTAILHGGD
ncbi:anthocyanidin 3-O-glucosyltransferase 2-like [Miscanthus floridulus]|uniref:anthocyanidin 3-O-glucosyltransferase 2-like n=1 Tax=Miscanthus floridulus TaxID=154761 RepID=UPI003457FAEE